jgi:hypothetical protein
VDDRRRRQEHALLVVDLVPGFDELDRVLKQERLDHDERAVHVEQQLAEMLELEDVCGIEDGAKREPRYRRPLGPEEHARALLNHFMSSRMIAEPALLMISFSRIASISAMVGSGFFSSSAAGQGGKLIRPDVTSKTSLEDHARKSIESRPSSRSPGEAMAVPPKPCPLAPAGGWAGRVAKICFSRTTTVLGNVELRTPFCGGAQNGGNQPGRVIKVGGRGRRT